MDCAWVEHRPFDMSRCAWLLSVCVLGAFVLAPAAAAFDCSDARCPQIKTCAEAYYKLEVSGHGDRDADNDGIPCEELCGKDLETYKRRVTAQWPAACPSWSRRSLRAMDAIVPPATAETVPNRNFACGAERTCGQMSSCEEATFYLTRCGLRRLDADGDGVACEGLCRGP